MPWNWLKRKLTGTPAPAPAPTASKPADLPPCPWIEPADNPWGIRVIDVRPITLGLLSTSSNPACAQNAISFGQDDGTSFIDVAPVGADRSVPANLSYPIDAHLADGALFVPEAMEHKWAIYLHRGRVIFVRSWTRAVAAVADLEVRGQTATITRIHGSFGADPADEAEAADFDYPVRIVDFLMRTHTLRVPFPAPLPGPRADGEDTSLAGLLCMSMFGQLAHFAAYDPVPPDRAAALPPLRTHSLLHIATARADLGQIRAHLAAGVPITLLAQDGGAPLHWAIKEEAARALLDAGSPVDVRSDEGATPLMVAVQAVDAARVELFLARGADVNARDNRGFTALHRAAEMGKLDLVRRLLAAGAERDPNASGHTPASLARQRGETEILNLLTAHP